MSRSTRLRIRLAATASTRSSTASTTRRSSTSTYNNYKTTTTTTCNYNCINYYNSAIIQRNRRVYYSTFFVVGYAVPLAVICVFYVLLVRRASVVGSTSLIATARRRRVMRMVTAVIVTFAVCWLPMHMAFLVEAYVRVIEYRIEMVAFQIVATCLAYSNSCLNPAMTSVILLRQRRQQQRLLLLLQLQLSESGHLRLPVGKFSSEFQRTFVRQRSLPRHHGDPKPQPQNEAFSRQRQAGRRIKRGNEWRPPGCTYGNDKRAQSITYQFFYGFVRPKSRLLRFVVDSLYSGV